MTAPIKPSETIEQKALRIAYKVFTPKQLATLTHDTGPYDVTVPNFELVEFARCLTADSEPVAEVAVTTDGSKQFIRTINDAILEPGQKLYASPPGVVVPIEPTEAMKDAGNWAYHRSRGAEYCVTDTVNEIYRAMLAAAESAPASVQRSVPHALNITVPAPAADLIPGLELAATFCRNRIEIYAGATKIPFAVEHLHEAQIILELVTAEIERRRG